ncbi:MAG: hypothetical protein GC164_10835 [Phycisphaera sp.]|nr:hypothetical protein [Phycisphaera sp.]
MPNKRTIVVLASLLGTMTLVSSLLMALEPGPIAPLGVLRLTSLDTQANPGKLLFDTQPAVLDGRWTDIVIRYSGSPTGSAATVSAQHEAQGRGGLGDHFVITNGKGGPDGQVQVGYRWRAQLDGAHTIGQWATHFNTHGVGICLVGDGNRTPPTDAQMRELLWLVRQLQTQLGITPDHIYVEAGDNVNGSTPRLFPLARFRQQLLTPETR